MNNKITLELVWWLFTAVVVGAIMFPIWKDFPEFKFQITNIAFIVCFVTFARYTFFLKHTFIATFQLFKIVFVLATLALIGVLLVQMQDFNVWLDNGDPDKLLASVKESKRAELLEYIKTEIIFFAVGSMIAALFLSGRLLISYWRLVNRGKA